MPHSVASDLGLGCLPMSHLRDVRHKWIKTPSLHTIFVCPKILNRSILLPLDVSKTAGHTENSLAPHLTPDSALSNLDLNCLKFLRKHEKKMLGFLPGKLGSCYSKHIYIIVRLDCINPF